MKKLLVFFLTISMTAFLSSAAWGVVGCGARATGMGGAFTAVADDGSAPYWNPAGMPQIKFLSFTPSFGVEGKVEKASEFTDPSGNIVPIGGANFNLGSLNYIGFTSKYVGINAFVDLNASYDMNLQTRKVTQGGESYAYGALSIAGSFTDQLAIGINLKSVQTVVMDGNVNADTNSGDTKTAKGAGMACDLGVLYWLTSNLKLGLMGRNIYSKIDWTEAKQKNYVGGSFVGENTWNPSQNLDTSYVVGLAYNPYESLTIAADVEIIDDPVINANDQTKYHIGLEQTALWESIALRLGAYTNKGKTGVTGGLGFKLGPVLLDLAGITEGKEYGFYLTGGFKF